VTGKTTQGWYAIYETALSNLEVTPDKPYVVLMAGVHSRGVVRTIRVTFEVEPEPGDEPRPECPGYEILGSLMVYREPTDPLVLDYMRRMRSHAEKR
jgi:hypothetical protein